MSDGGESPGSGRARSSDPPVDIDTPTLIDQIMGDEADDVEMADQATTDEVDEDVEFPNAWRDRFPHNFRYDYDYTRETLEEYFDPDLWQQIGFSLAMSETEAREKVVLMREAAVNGFDRADDLDEADNEAQGADKTKQEKKNLDFATFLAKYETHIPKKGEKPKADHHHPRRHPLVMAAAICGYRCAKKIQCNNSEAGPKSLVKEFFLCEYGQNNFDNGCFTNQYSTKFRRGAISDYFGRNKNATHDAPSALVWCRKHYQAAAYADGAWQFKKPQLLRLQLNRNAFDVKYDPFLGDKPRVLTYTIELVSKDLDRFLKFARGHSNGEPLDKEDKHAADLEDLKYINKHFCGQGKSLEDCHALVDYAAKILAAKVKIFKAGKTGKITEKEQKIEGPKFMAFEMIPEFGKLYGPAEPVETESKADADGEAEDGDAAEDDGNAGEGEEGDGEEDGDDQDTKPKGTPRTPKKSKSTEKPKKKKKTKSKKTKEQEAKKISEVLGETAKNRITLHVRDLLAHRETVEYPTDQSTATVIKEEADSSPNGGGAGSLLAVTPVKDRLAVLSIAAGIAAAEASPKRGREDEEVESPSSKKPRPTPKGKTGARKTRTRDAAKSNLYYDDLYARAEDDPEGTQDEVISALTGAPRIPATAYGLTNPPAATASPSNAPRTPAKQQSPYDQGLAALELAPSTPTASRSTAAPRTARAGRPTAVFRPNSAPRPAAARPTIGQQMSPARQQGTGQQVGASVEQPGVSAQLTGSSLQQTGTSVQQSGLSTQPTSAATQQSQPANQDVDGTIYPGPNGALNL